MLKNNIKFYTAYKLFTGPPPFLILYPDRLTLALSFRVSMEGSTGSLPDAFLVALIRSPRA